MSDVIVNLGGVPFQGFEVPEKIVFGGAQRVAVQRLIGGGRVVNVLGGDTGEIVFDGIFAGDDATGRAQALNAIRVLGGVVPLLWGEFFYLVVVVEFIADYLKPWWIPFSIRCVVADDPVADIVQAAADAVSLIGSDIAAAAGFSGQAGVSVAGLVVPTAVGLIAAQAAIGSSVGDGGFVLAGGVSALSKAADAPSGVAAMQNIVAASASLAGLSGMSGYINRAAVNFAGQLT